jgi:hypothetical protein
MLSIGIDGEYIKTPTRCHPVCGESLGVLRGAFGLSRLEQMSTKPVFENQSNDYADPS